MSNLRPLAVACLLLVLSSCCSALIAKDLMRLMGDVQPLRIEGEPTRPQDPERLSSDIIMYIDTGGPVVNLMPGLYFTDASEEVFRLQLTFEDLPGYPANITMIAQPDHYWELIEGVCRDFVSYNFFYYDLFYFVEFSSYFGQQEVMGVDCDVWGWKLQVDDSDFIMTAAVLTDDPNRYVQLNYTFGSLFESYAFPPNGYYEWDYCPQWAIDVPERCLHEGGVQCPGEDEVVEMDMVRFHPADSYELTNMNTADFRGDTSFLCLGLEGNQTKNQIISLYTVEVNTKWGQYALCNSGVCVGGNGYSVGHEVAYGVQPLGWQCRNNTDFGNWYSMRGDARCNDTSVANSTDGCAWRVLELKKSISLSCLTSGPFVDACQSDGMTFPFDAATAALEAAFVYDDPSKGGCPDVGVVSADDWVEDPAPKSGNHFGGLAHVADLLRMHELH